MNNLKFNPNMYSRYSNRHNLRKLYQTEECTGGFNPYNIKTQWMPFKEGITLFGAKTNIDGGREILSYNMEYAEDSTKENPKIKVYGKYNVSQEEYLEIVTLKDIDLSNASMIELQALRAHLAKQDKSFKDLNVDCPRSSGIDLEFGKRYDILSEFQRDVYIYKAGGYNDCYLRYSRALDKFLDFFNSK